MVNAHCVKYQCILCFNVIFSHDYVVVFAQFGPKFCQLLLATILCFEVIED